MCIVAVDAPSGSTDISLSSPHDDVERSSGEEKRQNAADERKEKSRDAARERRAKEFEYFQASPFHNKSLESFKRIQT